MSQGYCTNTILLHIIFLTAVVCLAEVSYFNLEHDCRQINSTSQCQCEQIDRNYIFDCETKDSKIQVEVSTSDTNFSGMKIWCYDIGPSLYSVLPKLNIASKWIIIHDCPMSRQSIHSVLQKFGTHSPYYLEIFTNLYEKLTHFHFKGLEYIEYLHLYSDNISPLPEDIFADLKNVIRLTLALNITDLPQNIFASMTNLKRLTFETENLKSLPPGIFFYQKKLGILEIKNNLKIITNETFKGLYELREIKISGNCVESLPEALNVENKKLRTFHLTTNKPALKRLPARLLSNLPRLQTVEITCGLEYIHQDAFANSSRILDINLSKNQLTKLPPELFRDQESMTELDLSENHFVALPDNVFHNNRELYKLRLSHNHLEHISSDIFYHAMNLVHLDMDNNNLIKISPMAFRNTPSLDYINMNNNQLKFDESSGGGPETGIYNKFLFQDLKHLRTLKLRNNSIQAIFNGDLLTSQKLDTLDLSHNNITNVEFDDLLYNSKSLTLDLTHNTIRTIHFPDISESYLKVWHNQINVSIGNNPLHCDCELLFFIQFLNRTSKQQEPALNNFVDDLKCNSPKNLAGRLLTNLDTKEIRCPLGLSIIRVPVAIFGLCFGVLAALYYKYRLQFKMWLYSHNMCLWLVTEEELDKNKKYDAFISYSHKDEEFITNHLLPELENGPTPYKLCLHARDWVVGDFIPDQILRSVDESRRTIIVLSPNFIESMWGTMEFRAAHTAALSERRRARVIVIIYGEIGNTDSLDPELKAYLENNTYVEWGDLLFWKKLRYAMPHSSTYIPEQSCSEQETGI